MYIHMGNAGELKMRIYYVDKEHNRGTAKRI